MKININWYLIWINTQSKHPNIICLLNNHIDKINWFYLSRNPNAIPLLNRHKEKINWVELSGNPNAIFLFL
jgi:hypothetical protein